MSKRLKLKKVGKTQKDDRKTGSDFLKTLDPIEDRDSNIPMVTLEESTIKLPSPFARNSNFDMKHDEAVTKPESN